MSHGLLCALDGRRVRHLHVNDEVALVLRRNESCGHGDQTVIGEKNEHRIDEQSDGAKAHDLAQPADVKAIGGVEPSIEESEEPGEQPIDPAREPILLCTLGAQQQGGEGGAERQGIEG